MRPVDGTVLRSVVFASCRDFENLVVNISARLLERNNKIYIRWMSIHTKEANSAIPGMKCVAFSSLVNGLYSFTSTS